MKIIKTNVADLNANKKLLYKLVKLAGLNVQKLTDEQKNLSYPVEQYLYYEDVNSKGEDVKILSIISGDTKLSTISKTFIDSFFGIVELMEDEPFAIKIGGGQSKAGRNYVDCLLDCD